RRSSAAHLRAIRASLVRVFDPSATGKSEARRLRRARHPEETAPMIWAEAEGCRVVDSQGRSYIDLSGGFGVAALGHRNPEIQAAVRAQADRCVHALGDLAEADVAAELRGRLGGAGREVMLGVTGEDAVEIALRTAMLVTGRPGIVAFG